MSYVIQTKNFSFDRYHDDVCTKADLVFCSTFEEAEKIALGYVCDEMKSLTYDYPDIRATVYTDEGKEMYYVFGKYNTKNSSSEIYEEFEYIDETGHEDRRTNLIAKIVDDGERKIVFANENEQEKVNDYYEEDFIDI